jgi:dihydrofolate synthase / folylpolyglutamate synthase
MTYDAAQAYIASLAPRGWRLGLDRMEEFVRRAGLTDALGPRSPSSPGFIHIGGTNGKGSVTAFVQSILQTAGLRVGAFYSPYVYDPRERVQANGRMIDEAEFASAVEALLPAAVSLEETDFGGVTEFEYKTAVGFLHWRRQQCDLVALEVGLGGRLDATNVVTPEVSVIVSIGLDHVAILGNTHAEIAGEKAGIIKRGRPVVIGELPPDAEVAIRAKATEESAPVWQIGREMSLSRQESGWTVSTPAGMVERLEPGLYGIWQPHNMALAIAACQLAEPGISEEAIRHGVAAASVPGRFEVRSFLGKTVILDGAHNGEAADALAEALERRYPNRRLPMVIGMVEGHDPRRFVQPLERIMSRAHITPINFRRGVAPEDLAPQLGSSSVPHANLKEALQAALAEGDTVVITGSFYLIGEAGNLLQEWETAAAHEAATNG